MKINMAFRVAWLWVLMGLMVCGCNSYRVTALPYDEELKRVVIVENPKVKVSDFVNVMTDEFNKRNIRAEQVSNLYISRPDDYVLRYEARKSWFLMPFLSDATVRINKDGMTVAKGKYHHVGESFSLDFFTKWLGTSWKMKRFYRDLLKNYEETADR